MYLYPLRHWVKSEARMIIEAPAHLAHYIVTHQDEVPECVTVIEVGSCPIDPSLDGDSCTTTITFDGIPVPYNFLELDEVALAYAISVHKSQGSEYQTIVIPIMSQHYVLLQRNLIYTAVTRGKRLVVMVGSKEALAIGVRNDRIMRRYTHLAERLKRP